MSRKNAKLCRIHDLQNRKSDIILTKKDCDMIANALCQTYDIKEIESLYYYFIDLGRL